MPELKGQGNAFELFEELQNRKPDSEEKNTGKNSWNELKPNKEFKEVEPAKDPDPETPAEQPEKAQDPEPYQGGPSDWNFKMNGTPQEIHDLKKETIQPAQMDFEKIEKQNRLYAAIMVEVGLLVLQYGTMALAGEFNDKGEKMFKVNKVKADELKEHTFQVLMLDADKPKNPKVALVYLGVGISLPMLVIAGKMRYDKVKEKKKSKKAKAHVKRIVDSVADNATKQQEEQEVLEEIQERDDRDTRGRKKGMKKNPDTGKMELFQVYDPELGKVYSWELDKLKEIKERIQGESKKEEKPKNDKK